MTSETGIPQHASTFMKLLLLKSDVKTCLYSPVVLNFTKFAFSETI